MARKPKVFLGVGHGGWETGAYANGIKEKDANLTTALACNEVLVRHGVDTLMSRTTDEEDTLRQEINECNAFDPELAVDMHHNAGKGDGVEVFHHYGGGVGKELAENIHNEIVALGQNSRGVKTRVEDGADYYGFIRETKCPAVIVEYAFLDNDKDVQFVDTEAEQKANGVATAKGILKQLGIPYIEPKKEIYRVVLGEFSSREEADKALGEMWTALSTIAEAVGSVDFALHNAQIVEE